ncbi:MAG TPA: chorismate synthase [Gammaproteobacteria bacterium]|nr:chorismate synthase [Gammaproteobacteria bacterium]
MSANNTFGSHFRLTTFGESHGTCIGGIIDGCPAGFTLDLNLIQKTLTRRRPGQFKGTTQRKETDQVQWLSGLKDSVTTGTPIAFNILNEGQNTQDYSKINKVFRPGHAQYTYQKKYGTVMTEGGGRSSGRETAIRVAAGAIAKQMLAALGTTVSAHVHQCGDIYCDDSWLTQPYPDLGDTFPCPDPTISSTMQNFLEDLQASGDSCGGLVAFQIHSSPIGLGDPIYQKLEAQLAHAMLSIPATKGFEIGQGFNSATMKGSDHNDEMNPENIFSSNQAGGILGGISNGQCIYGKVAFKPTSSIQKTQKTMTFDHQPTTLNLSNKRHDPCIAIRGSVVVEAMCALVLMDRLLANQSTQWNHILSSPTLMTQD